MLHQFLALAVTAVLAATTLATPLNNIPSSTSSSTPAPTPTRVRPVSSCTIIAGENPYVIANYTRPACVCNCLASVCGYITDGSRQEIIDCATLPWPTSENPWSNQLIIEMGRCTGSQRCIG
ncbi:hypothetical protein QBC39DRAFT_351544 [Podospora conica]|nr:hypothetical protein QBC39DRAFT_351544 [Schizothecium conicum]